MQRKLQQIPLAFSFFQFNMFMLAIWHLKPFLQRRFPLHRRLSKDWIGFFGWCCIEGSKDYAILRENSELQDFLRSKVDLPRLTQDEWEGQISLAILCCGMARYRWCLAPLVRSAKARKRAARAFWRGERHAQFLPTSRWQLENLSLEKCDLSALLKKIYLPDYDHVLSNEELSDKFGLEDVLEFSKSGVSNLSDGQRQITIDKEHYRSFTPLHPKIWRLVCDFRAWLRSVPSEKERCSVMEIGITDYSGPYTQKCFTLGVNLYGYAHGELGIGEDIRQVAVALQSEGIPVCILNFQPGSNISQADRSADPLIVTEPRYGINIFCMTGIETTRYVCEKGLSALEGRYNIGLWPWELPDWPESCRHAYACVDEIWGISEYTARAHRHAAPRPVMPMTLPVELGAVGEQTRGDFGLPENPFLFYFAFDINSNAARKNPEGLIEAFQKAFATENQDQVGLVLKISHPETSCKLWSKIRRIAKRDKRIRVVEKTLRRPELLALFKACDCLVSLHRAEGFGRCIAEALLLDKQVIATGFSGNLDFCHEPRVALVRHSMRALTAKDYMWGEGQSWAEPDLDHAAKLMRSIWKNPRETRHRDFDFSPSTVGSRYSARLKEIWKSHAVNAHGTANGKSTTEPSSVVTSDHMI
jgi:hypothetical protein